MSEVIKIRLGKKDYIVRTWWDNASKNGINLSRVINCAVHHYTKTGRYLAIACINDTTWAENSEPTTRQIYLPSESESYKWLTEKKEVGEKVSTTIKRILKRSIIWAADEVFYSEDELQNIVDMIGTEVYEQLVSNQITTNISIPNIGSIIYQPDNLSGARHINKNIMQREEEIMENRVVEKEKTAIGSERITKVASWDDSDDDNNGGPDLYDALLGGTGLSL